MKRIWIESVTMMAITLLIDLALFAYRTSYWIVFLATAGIFVGGDIYYRHHAQGGHDNE